MLRRGSKPKSDRVPVQVSSDNTEVDATSSKVKTPVELMDFGQGPVEASRHVNPDGSLGGWVAVTAHADEGAYVSETAFVLGNSRVFGNCRVEDEALVFDNARIHDGAQVAGEAMVGGDCTLMDVRVEGRARIMGRAHLTGRAHVLGEAKIGGEVRVLGPAVIDGRANLKGKVFVSGGRITEDALVDGDAVIKPGAVIDGEMAVYSGTFVAEAVTGVPEVADDGRDSSSEPTPQTMTVPEGPSIPSPGHVGSTAVSVG